MTITSAIPRISEGHNCVVNQSSSTRPCPVEIECNGARVIVREVVNHQELIAAFRLVYHVYVEELKCVDPSKLTRSCRESKGKWDQWDFRPSTRHIVAVHDGRIVGHVRLLFGKDGPLPLEENGFDISATREECEVGKFVVHQEFRGSGILSAFYRQIFGICRDELHLPSIIISSEPHNEALYARIGAVALGSFMNLDIGKTCLLMRIMFASNYDEQLGGGLLGRKHGRFQRTFIPPQELLEALRPPISNGMPYLWSAFRMNEDVGNTAGLWRLTVGGRGAVAKVIRSAAPEGRGGADISEVEAYGFLSAHPMLEVLRSPKLLATHRGPDTTVLLMEDVWTSGSRYLTYSDVLSFARSLGKLQGQMQDTGTAKLPASTLELYMREAEPAARALPTLVRRSGALAPITMGADWEWTLRLWRSRHELLQAMVTIPRAFAHRNLLFRNCIVQTLDHCRQCFVLVGWGRSGIDTIGSDLGPLVFGNSLAFAWSVADAVKIWRPTIAAYTKGLSEGGITIDVRTVHRLASSIALLRHIAWSWSGHRFAGSLTSLGGPELETRATHHSIEAVVERYCDIRAALLRLCAEINDHSTAWSS